MISRPKFTEDHAALLLLVYCEVEHKTRRDIIRKTYGRDARHNNVFVTFNMGRTPDDMTSRMQKMIEDESKEYNDILQHNIIEHPWNMTLITLAGLKWYQDETSKIPYILQTRSETFVNIEKWSYIFR